MQDNNGNKININTTFVFNDVEVKLTGRTASKVYPATARIPERTEVKVEITPADRTVNGTWKKWVKQTELYGIDE